MKNVNASPDSVDQVLSRKRLLGITLALLLAVVAVFLLFALVPRIFGERSVVGIVGAELRPSGRLSVVVASCEGSPKVTVLRESETSVEIQVVAGSPGIFEGTTDCQDVVEVVLREPLGDRSVVELDSGRIIPVERINS